MWRGSHTHDEDMRTHMGAMLDVYKKYPDWKWYFVGKNPYWITNKMDSDRCFYTPFVNNARQYVEFLQSKRAAIHIVPLVDNTFNRSKSRVSHIEATLAGSACLTPNWQEWEGGRAYRYRDTETFHSELVRMVESPLEELAEVNKDSFTWVKENRALHRINEKRAEVLKFVMQKYDSHAALEIR